MKETAKTRAQTASPWAVAAAFTVVAITVTVWFPYAERRNSLGALEHSANDEARLIAYTIAPAIDFGDVQIIEDAFRAAEDDPDFRRISATNSDGREIAHRARPGAGPSAAELLEVSAPIALPDGAAGTLRLVLSKERINRASRRELLISGAMGATIIALGVFVSLWVARSIRRITTLLVENERARVAAEEANLVKSRFLANMSHEIRTPLNGVLGLSDVLARRRLDGESMGLVRSIGRSARTLLALVNDVLDLSRAEAGRLELESAPLDVEAAAASAIEMLVPTCRRKGIELVLAVDANVPGSVLGDRLRFVQILTNLAGNAVKFTDNGGVRVSLGWDGGSLRVSIADQGIGIAEEKHGTIFDTFSQADTSTTRRYGGSGLGLAISRQLVRQMGGDIDVASEIGAGSTFSFTVPFASVTPAPAAVPSPGGHAIIVAGAPSTRALLMGHAVRCGLSAEEATLDDVLARARESAPATLVVWDVSAPPPSAEQIAELAKAVEERRIRFVVHAAPCDEEPLKELALDVLPVGFSREAFERAASAEPGAMAAHRTLSEPIRAFNAHVLIAEDDETNMLVLSSFLAEIGVTAETVTDGLLAVARATSSDHFDMILMDCQMPELDGYEAARRIRAWEARTGRDRVPIVACTAHALPAERQRATAVGMDGYLTKPLTLEAFRETLARYARGRAAPETEPERRGSRLEVLEQIGKDRELVARLGAAFARGSSTALTGIAEALAAGDWENVRRHAHTLKGSCLSLGAGDAAALAAALEARARAEDSAGASAALIALEIAVEDVRLELEEVANAAAAE